MGKRKKKKILKKVGLFERLNARVDFLFSKNAPAFDNVLST
jgi:hypothetical protein